MRAAASDSLLTSEDRTGDEAVECAMGNSTVPAAAAPSGPESPTGVTKKAFAGKSAICATAQVRTVNPGPAERRLPLLELEYSYGDTAVCLPSLSSFLQAACGIEGCGFRCARVARCTRDRPGRAHGGRPGLHSKRTSLVLELVTRGFLVTSKMGVRSTTSSLRVGYIFMFTPK